MLREFGDAELAGLVLPRTPVIEYSAIPDVTGHKGELLYRVMPEFADNRWSTARRHPTQPPDKFVAGARPFRCQFQEEGMGRFDEPLLAPSPRTRLVSESARWTAYDVVLDVWPEVFAWGVLVVPKDLKPGERRLVVVCQHGRNGLPRDTIDRNQSAYNNFAGTLADRGFITFAPHNLHRGEDRYRWLNRKANTVKAALFSFITIGVECHSRPARINC